MLIFQNEELEEILKVAHVLPTQLDLERKLGLVEAQCREKDKSIVALTSQIEEQVSLLFDSMNTWNLLWLLAVSMSVQVCHK